MAASLNKVFIMGNLTRDPELRYVPSGAAVASFTVAVNRVYKDKAGEKKEETSFIKVIIWGKMAEVCGEYLSKGKPVLVEGRLQSRSWEGTDGQKKSAVEVIASTVQFLGGKTQRDTSSDPISGSGGLGSVDLNSEGAEDGGFSAISDNDEIPF
ncbi:MAG: single-stranded DNA-binding protein [Candidatus Omnitrophica bacterium]|nr:single-stranded DNA-binding protein [Candidatus Omnitrophota bacterium]